MTLLLSLLMGLLVVFALGAEWLNIHLNEKNLATIRQHDALFYTVDHYAQQILTTDFTSCLLNASTDPNHYPQELPTHSFCTAQTEHISLNYAIEDLGPVPCYFIDDNNAHFYRVTVLGKSHWDSLLTLQIIYATPENNTSILCERTETYAIQTGIQSWRIVPTT